MCQIIGDISGGSGNFLDISANTTITGPVRIDGELGVTGDIITDGSLNVTGTGVFGGNLTAAKTPLIAYIEYTNADFSSENITTGRWDTIAVIHPITAISSQMDNRAPYAIFEIVDRSNNSSHYKFQEN